MKLLDVLTAPWAIEPAKLAEIQSIYATHLRGEKINIAAVEARLGHPLVSTESKRFEVTDGVAVIPLEGVIAKRMNLFSQISGGVSTELAARDLREALADPAVHSIILAIDSPGGTVDGTQGLADVVSEVGSAKPVVTLASGTMASAAYWIGSAAKAAYIADSTTAVGSIGVVARHTDISRAEEMSGVKTTEVFAGKYKRIASQYEPLSKEGRQTIQDQVDYTYSLFVGAVAKHRGVSEQVVLKDMADGRVFVGQQAIDAGLVDGVSTLESLIKQLNREHFSSDSRAGVAHAVSTQGKTMTITREQLAAQAPELLNAILAEGATGGASAERDRIFAVQGQLIPGHEALIESLKRDGKSGAGEAAMAVLAAERQSRVTHADKLAKDAPTALSLVPSSTVATSEKAEKTRGEIDAAAKAHMAAHPGTSYVAAVKQISQGA